LVRPYTAIKTYIESATEAPRQIRVLYLGFPFSTFETISMLIGPAIGIAKMKPAIRAASEMFRTLSSIIDLYNSFRVPVCK
jgi:hypothetical protein